MVKFVIFMKNPSFGENFLDGIFSQIEYLGKKRQAKLDELTDGGSKAADITATQFKG